MVKGGREVDGTPPQSFWYVAVFQNHLPSVESLWSSQQDKVCFIFAGGLWRHEKWSPSWLPSWILPSIRNQVKTSFHPQALLLLLKEVEKHAFSLKNGLTTCYLWHHSRNLSNWTSLNLSQNVLGGINEQLLKMSGADVLSLRKKLKKKKSERGGGNHPPPPLYIPGLRSLTAWWLVSRDYWAAEPPQRMYFIQL